MRSFELVKPDSLEEASRRAATRGLFKAAGIDVLDRLKERREDPGRLVDLLALRELRGITAGEDGVRIGALTTLRELADAAVLAEPRFAALQQAAARTATPQIRNRATAGGNLLQMTRCWYLRSSAFGCAHGGDGPDCLAFSGENRYHAVLGGVDCYRVHPSSIAPALVVLDARVRIRGADGERTIPILGLFPETATADEPEHTLAAGEVLAEILLPAQPAGARSAFRESREKESFDWPTTAAAVRLELDGGTIRDARICLGAVAPNPWPAAEAAARLAGRAPSEELFAAAAADAYAEAQPLAQNAYKIEVGQAVLRDALRAACETR